MIKKVPDAPIFASDLSSESLKNLIEGKISYILRPSYYELSKCEAAHRTLDTTFETRGRMYADPGYTVTMSLNTIGMSVAEVSDDTSRDKYLKKAESTARFIRDVIFAGSFAPMDRFRVEADFCWKHGVHIPRIDGFSVLPYVIRMWTKKGGANPHQDPVNAELIRQLGLTKRLGVNVYLDMPRHLDDGGSVYLWPGRIPDNEYDLLRKESKLDHGLSHDTVKMKLNSDPIEVRPNIGDLLIFDASNIHAVEELKNGARRTAASFLGYVGNNSPLYMFA